MPRLTREVLAKLCPRPKAADKASIWDGYVDALTSPAFEKLLTDFKVITSLRLAHVLAQWAHESGGFSLVWESGTYSKARILQIFGVGKHSAKVTEREAQVLAGDGPALFERVYGLGNPSKARELGNTQTGDGWAFRGCGIVQLTGRAAHEEYARDIGCSLTELAQPINSIHGALLEWADKGCNALADKDDITAITKKINGGSNGLAERKSYLIKVKTLLKETVTQPVGNVGELIAMSVTSGDVGTGCAWIDAAVAKKGLKEAPGAKNNTAIVALYKACGHPEVEYDSVAWCAALVGACLAEAGKPLPPTATNLMARSYLKYGTKLDKPRPHCIAVWARGKPPQGHVGFVLEVDEAKGTIKTIEGNVGDQVQIKTHKISEALDYRWPPETGAVAAFATAGASKSTWLTVSGLFWLIWGYILDGAQSTWDGIWGIFSLLPGMGNDIESAMGTGEKFSSWLGLPMAKVSAAIVGVIMLTTLGRHLKDKLHWKLGG